MRAKTVHGHGWLVGVLGLAVGITLIVAFPRFKAISGAIVLVGLFHLAGIAVIFGSVYAFAPGRTGRLMEHLHRRAPGDREYDFGWSWGALSGPWLAAGALWALVAGLQLEWPGLWPAWFALSLLGVGFFTGGLALRMSKRADFASLPLVELLASDQDLVLDAGCGGGRTTIELSKVLRGGRIVDLDRFDAPYINGGGRALLERNLRIGGLTDRVTIEEGDLTAVPFPDAHFDSAVSAHAIDHLGPHKQAGLAEVFRVLKPGGRFLMVVWVPGWVTFSLQSPVPACRPQG